MSATRQELRDRITWLDKALDTSSDQHANRLLAKAILTSCMVNLEHMESAERSSEVIEGQGAQLLEQFNPTAWLEQSGRLAWALANLRDHTQPTIQDAVDAEGLIERLRVMAG